MSLFSLVHDSHYVTLLNMLRIDNRDIDNRDINYTDFFFIFIGIINYCIRLKKLDEELLYSKSENSKK